MEERTSVTDSDTSDVESLEEPNMDIVSLYERDIRRIPLLKAEEKKRAGENLARGLRGIRSNIARAIREARSVSANIHTSEFLAVTKKTCSTDILSPTHFDEIERALSVLIKSPHVSKQNFFLKELAAIQKEFLKYRKDFESARNVLIRHNLRLAFDRAKKRGGNASLPLPDVTQEANIGLIKAAQRFDISRKCKFSTVATWWINQAIFRAFQEKTRIIEIPVHVHEKYLKVSRGRRFLNQHLGREATFSELAEHLHMSPKTVFDIDQCITKEPISLDEIIKNACSKRDGRDVTLHEVVADGTTILPDEAYFKKEQKEGVQRVLAETLNPREQTIIRLRFGMAGRDPMMLDAIGQILGVTGERIRKIEEKALKKLKCPEVKKRLEPFLNGSAGRIFGYTTVSA